MTENLSSPSPADLRRLADEIESRECTGIAADWCPVHGACTCPKDDDGMRNLPVDGGFSTCLLHGDSSSHAAAAGGMP